MTPLLSLCSVAACKGILPPLLQTVCHVCFDATWSTWKCKLFHLVRAKRLRKLVKLDATNALIKALRELLRDSRTGDEKYAAIDVAAYTLLSLASKGEKEGEMLWAIMVHTSELHLLCTFRPSNCTEGATWWSAAAFGRMHLFGAGERPTSVVDCIACAMRSIAWVRFCSNSRSFPVILPLVAYPIALFAYHSNSHRTLDCATACCRRQCRCV